MTDTHKRVYLKCKTDYLNLIGGDGPDIDKNAELLENSKNGNLERVRQLLDDGADVNTRDNKENTP